MCPNCHKIMTCKVPRGSKRKYIYYKCNNCKTYIREDKLNKLLINEIASIMEYDNTVKKFFSSLKKRKCQRIIN